MMTLLVYDRERKAFLLDWTVSDLARAYKDTRYWIWLDIEDAQPEDTSVLSDIFQLDPLAIEDCLHPRQSPKLESFGHYHFFIVHSIEPMTENMTFQTVELDGFLADQFLITVHMDSMPILTTAKKHIQEGHSRFSEGTVSLAYTILDQLIDAYLPVLDEFDQQIQALESSLLLQQRFAPDLATRYHHLMTQLLQIRRISVRNQEVFYQFSHSDLDFIDPQEARLFRDIYDHVVRVVDLTGFYQQTLRGALDIQFSMNATRVNQVVQFLTVFATIMLPLNVITGIYGMNFESMPLLKSPYGFWITMSLMGLLILGMLHWFRKKAWI